MAAGSAEVESSVEAAASASAASECLSWLDNLKINTAVTQHHSLNPDRIQQWRILAFISFTWLQTDFHCMFYGSISACIYSTTRLFLLSPKAPHFLFNVY